MIRILRFLSIAFISILLTYPLASYGVLESGEYNDSDMRHANPDRGIVYEDDFRQLFLSDVKTFPYQYPTIIHSHQGKPSQKTGMYLEEVRVNEKTKFTRSDVVNLTADACSAEPTHLTISPHSMRSAIPVTASAMSGTEVQNDFEQMPPSLHQNKIGTPDYQDRKAKVYESLQKDLSMLHDSELLEVFPTSEQVRKLDDPDYERPITAIEIPLVHNVRFTEIDLESITEEGLMTEIGFVRSSDETLVLTIGIRSPDAKSLGIVFENFELPDGVEMYVYNMKGNVDGPYIKQGGVGAGYNWTVPLSGNTIAVELRIDRNKISMRAMHDLHFDITGVMYERANDSKRSTGTCSWNEDCTESAECYDSSDLGNIDKLRSAVAHIQVYDQDEGEWISCSGGLINHSGSDVKWTPYFLTAEHCVEDAAQVTTMRLWWDYRNPACGGECPSLDNFPHQQGATLLSSSKDQDYALLELSDTPPGIRAMMGWTEAPIHDSLGFVLHRISHPESAPQSYSEHIVDPSLFWGCVYPYAAPVGDYIRHKSSLNSIEGGSSGSISVDNDLRIRGVYSRYCGAFSACSGSRNFADGAFSAFYEEIRGWLVPPALTVEPELIEVGHNSVESNIVVENVGFEDMFWHVSASCDWTSLSPTSGVIEGGEREDVLLAVSENGSDTSRSCQIEIVAPEAIGSPAFVGVFQEGQGDPEPGDPPQVQTNSVSEVYQNSAILSANVNPNGSSTELRFLYGTNEADLDLVTVYGNVGSGNSWITNIEHTLDGIACNTTFHLRAEAENSSGITQGGTQSFRTSACSTGSPSIEIHRLRVRGADRIEVQTNVDRNGSDTNVFYEYGLEAGVYIGEVAFDYNPLTQDDEIDDGHLEGLATADQTISGLDCGTRYYFRPRAENAHGMSFTEPESEKTWDCPCDYSISPTEAAFGSNGGSGEVAVEVGNGCDWTVSSNDDWITVTSGSNGSGDGTVGYSVSENTSASGRTGTVTIAGETFTVSQDGKPCSYSITPTSRTVGSLGGAGTVSVSTPKGCDWTASSNDEWITVTSGSSGSGDGTVGYSVSENASETGRTGTLIIAGETFTVNQDGAEPADLILHVQSSGASSVPIEVSPQEYGGSTNYSVSVEPDITIILEAPESHDGAAFEYWSGCDDTISSFSGSERFFVDNLFHDRFEGVSATAFSCLIDSMDSDRTVTAHYDSPVDSASFLNDTGIHWCADDDTNNLDCPVASHPGQDGDHGRDALAREGLLNKVGAGAAGFDYTKLDNAGWPLPANATSWSCVRDNHTGLIWEVKNDDVGLHYKDATYSWYNPDSATNGGDPGTRDGGSCAISDDQFCDTDYYVESVNAQGLCGASDWRMPTVMELHSLSHQGRTSPAIDTGYFPNSPLSTFWSASPDAKSSTDAWGVNFISGSDFQGSKSFDRRIRLVRGEQ